MHSSSCLVLQMNPRRAMVQSRGDTIVSLLYAAAAGDLSALKRHKVSIITYVAAAGDPSALKDTWSLVSIIF